MLYVEQVLTCDICGDEMARMGQSVTPGVEYQRIYRGPSGVTAWKDVCSDCTGPLHQAVWALKVAKGGKDE